jgi:hypothetical protein
VAAGIAQSPPDAAVVLDPEPSDASVLLREPEESGVVLLDVEAASPVASPAPAFAAAPDPASVEPVSVEPVSAEPVSGPAESAPERAAAAEWRSFFAQPEPLKWTDGAEIALRTGPEPQSGQLVGGSPWTPWTTSKRRPQAAHT